MWTHHTGGKTFPIFEESRVKFQKFAHKGWREFLERGEDLLLKGGCCSWERIFPALLWLYLHFNGIKKGCQISFFQKMPPTKNALKVGEQDNCNID